MRYLEDESTYILGVFDTGDAVTINVYKLSDDSLVVNAAACSEIGATGSFKYSFSQAVAAKTEYLWVMTNGDYDQRGKIILGGYPDSIKDKTDNLPASPAPSGEYDTEAARITADVATEAKQDTIKAKVGFIAKEF